jgi:hypothetical protein
MHAKTLRTSGANGEEPEMIIQGRSIQPGPMQIDEAFANLVHHLFAFVSLLIKESKGE